VLDRPRAIILGLAAVFAVSFGLLTWAVTGDRTALDALDEWGQRADSWLAHHELIDEIALHVETVFGTVGMTLITAATAGLLWWKRHRRAAVYAVLVMATTALLTTVVKQLTDRQRPSWQDPISMLDSLSFPSGHVSSATAYAFVLVMISLMLIRRSSLRRLAYAGAAAMALLVAADRVLLGRHYVTDVLGGALLGATVALTVLAVYSPLPRPHAAKLEPLPATGQGTRDLAVVLNPVKVESVEEFQSIVTAMAGEAGWGVPSWHLTTVDDPGAGMAHAAAVAGADLVLVCGGDGTVREVCAELAGTGIPVGIVPAGTGNLLARNLDVPLFLRAAIDVGLNGQDRAIDLVRVSGDETGTESGAEFDTHFMVMAGMGLDAAIMEGVNDDIKKRIGWFAYVISAFKSLMVPAVRLEVSIDGGEPTKHRARTVVVGNVGFLQAGMPLMPDAAIDDGLLDVVLLHPRRFLSWIPLVVRVLSRQKRTDDTINRMTGRTVVVTASSPTPRQLDGDSIGPGLTLRMECVHGRLLVRVPRR